MIPRIDNKITDSEFDFIEAFSLYEGASYSLLQEIWKEEDFTGSSLKYYKLMQYVLAYYLVELMSIDFKEGFLTLEEIYKKYNIDCIRVQLACHDIDIDKIIEAYGIKEYNGEGIDFLEIDNGKTGTFAIDVDEVYTLNYDKVDVNLYINCFNKSINYIAEDKEVERKTLKVDTLPLTINNCENYLLI